MILEELNARLLGHWGRLLPDKQKPRVIHYLGIPGSVEGGTTTLVGFDQEQSSPLFAVKVHRFPAESRAVHERMVMNQIQACGGGPAGSIPRLILCEEIGGHWTLVQSIVKGRPMTVTIRSNGVPDIQESIQNMDLASHWLLDLHHATSQRDSGLQLPLMNEKFNTIEAFQKTFDVSAEERQVLDAISLHLIEMREGKVFIRHGDFCRQNILVERKKGESRLSVIDWTDAKKDITPMHDLCFFATSYFLQARSKGGVRDFVQAFESAFFEDNLYSAVIKRNLKNYCNTIGVDPAMAKIYFALFLVEQAMFEYHKLLKYAPYGGFPRFTMCLASSADKKYHEVMKEQLWIYFFRAFVRQQRRFIL